MASNHGVAFGGATSRAEQDNGKPICPLFCYTASKVLYLVAATVQEQSRIKFVWTATTRVWTLEMRVCCVLRYVCVCVGAYGPHKHRRSEIVTMLSYTS